MTTQTEAERLADQLEDPVNAKLYLAPYIAAELRRQASFINDLKDEVVEQCRINGMSAEREEALRAEVDRLNKALTWEQNRSERIGTHGPGCHLWGDRHYECLLRELDQALADEREACAKVCDRMAQRTQDIRSAALESAAENIRARGNA